MGLKSESSFIFNKGNKTTLPTVAVMSLDQAPEPTLKELKGRLETIQSSWIISMSLERRNQLNEQFKALAEQIKQKYGADGKKAVDFVVAKQMALKRTQ